MQSVNDLERVYPLARQRDSEMYMNPSDNIADLIEARQYRAALIQH
jgi:hypothetical protein